MDGYLAVIGFLIIFTVIGLLVWGKISPIVAMIIIPVIGSLVAGFGFEELTEFFSAGTNQVMDIAIMFIFAIIFFGIMNDSGLFNQIVRNLIIITKGNVVVVAIVTIVIAALAHLDGAGATTFLLTIPALIGLYKQLDMSPLLLVLLTTLSAGFMNVVPWGGPVGRIASVIGYDNPAILWYPLIPWQIVMFFTLIGFAIMLGLRERKRIAKHVENGEIVSNNVNAREIADDFIKKRIEHEESSEETLVKHPAMIWINAGILLMVLSLMLLDIVPPGFAFMIGVAIALPLNYRNANDQLGRIRAHAPAALMMASIILSAGIFLGVIDESGMLDSLSTSIAGILPDAAGPYIHIIVAIFGVPLDMMMSTDAYYFGIFPIVESIASNFGVASETTANMMLLGSTLSQGPVAPGLWLAIGLAGVQMGAFIRYAFFWYWGFGIVALIIGFFTGAF